MLFVVVDVSCLSAVFADDQDRVGLDENSGGPDSGSNFHESDEELDMLNVCFLNHFSGCLKIFGCMSAFFC